MNNKVGLQRSLKTFASAAALMLGATACTQTGVVGYDTIIRNGTIVDGSGLERFTGDVAIKGNHIAAVGNLAGAQAKTTIDAAGLVVAPGFINIHSHAQPQAVGTAVNMLTQGVTSEITNADGHGTTDITKQLEGFKANGLAENIGLYIGFNATWQQTVGDEDRQATPTEIDKMRTIIDGNLAQGAWGVAAGLDYKPAYFAEADEVVKVVSIAKKWRTNFPNHDRLRPEEQYSSYKGMAETISIAEQAGLVPVITHMKSQGAEQGNAPAVIKLMDEATARGTYTATDLYPYLAGQSGLAALLIPGWALDGGREAMLKRFADPATRARIIVEAEKAMVLRFGGPKGVYVLDTGQELTDAMAKMQVGPGEAVIRLLEGAPLGAILRFGAEEDLVAFLKYRNSAMACDCGATTEQKVHPRQWGSFPRVLGRYVRDEGVLTMEDAVRKMTALPATIVGMTERGYLAPGMTADIALFDPRTIKDYATYEQPTKPSEGVRHVFVNGQLALRDGQPTGVQNGEVLLRAKHMPSRPMTLATARSVSGSGTVSNGSSSFDVSLAVTQQARDRYARGRLQLVDRASSTVWAADRLGVIQTAPDWASLTATVRNSAGELKAVTVTVDRAGGGSDGSLIVTLDGQADLTGSLGADVKIASR